MSGRITPPSDAETEISHHVAIVSSLLPDNALGITVEAMKRMMDLAGMCCDSKDPELLSDAMCNAIKSLTARMAEDRKNAK